MQIRSESTFIWRFLLHLLSLPFILVMMLFGKRTSSDLLEPFHDFAKYLVEPVFTVSMIVLTTITTIWAWLQPQATIAQLINYPADLLQPERYYSFITAGFIHANWMHLASNMLFLFIFGRIVERKLGAAKTSVIYFTALIVAGVASCALSLLQGDATGGLGASGAIMGLVATGILLDPFYIVFELIVPLPALVVGWLQLYTDVTGVFTQQNDGIGHIAHIGGYLSALLALLWLNQEEKRHLQRGLLLNGITLLLAGIIFYFIRT